LLQPERRSSVPPDRLTLREALVLARARWQIARLFKLWKGHLRVDKWRSANPWRILTEVYAKLLAALVLHWLTLVGCWHHPDRSLVKAAQAIQAHAAHLAAGFDAHAPLCRALQAVVRSLAVGHLDKRRAAPSTTQLLLALDTSALVRLRRVCPLPAPRWACPCPLPVPPMLHPRDNPCNKPGVVLVPDQRSLPCATQCNGSIRGVLTRACYHPVVERGPTSAGIDARRCAHRRGEIPDSPRSQR